MSTKFDRLSTHQQDNALHLSKKFDKNKLETKLWCKLICILEARRQSNQNLSTKQQQKDNADAICRDIKV